jgi:hypothetical protein
MTNLPTISTICPQCHGKGWLRLTTGWPIECDDCVPTKVVKGKVTLDKQRIAAIERAKKHDSQPAPSRYIGCGTTEHFEAN